MSRLHVHLSSDRNTAVSVGARHGRPIVFVVLASNMYQAGYSFYESANQVWLTDHVPPDYLDLAT